MDGLADPDRRRDGVAALLCLHRNDPRQFAAELREPARVRCRVPPTAVWQCEDIRRASELLDELERSRLLSFDAVRVRRVDDGVAVAFRELERRRERILECSVDRDEATADRTHLTDLARCD